MESTVNTPKIGLRAFGNRIVVKEYKEDPSGIVLPDGVYKEWYRGIVVEASEHFTDLHELWQPPRVGDVVFYTKAYKVRDYHVVEIGNIIAVED